VAPGQAPFKIVEVTDLSVIPPSPAVPQSTLVPVPPPPTDLIGPGDVLNITVYEAGVSLFGKGATRVGTGTVIPGLPSANQDACVGRRLQGRSQGHCCACPARRRQL